MNFDIRTDAGRIRVNGKDHKAKRHGKLINIRINK